MKIYGIILAAGMGTRAGGDKLSKEIDAKPMLFHTVERAMGSSLTDLILVTGAQRLFGEDAAKKYSLMYTHNPDYRLGLSTSLKAGLAALPEEAEGFAVLLGDMPFIESGTIDALLKVFRENAARFPIVLPIYKGRRGHPPIFSAIYKKEIMKLDGDRGAKPVIVLYKDKVISVDVKDRGTIEDVDSF